MKAECLIAQMEIATAVETAISAIEQAGELKRRDLEAQSMRVYARALRKRGDVADARDIARQAWQIVEKDFDVQKRAQFALEYALCLSANNQHAEAVDLVESNVRGVRLVEPEYIFRELDGSFGELVASA